MAIQQSVAVRNAMLDAFETTVSTSAKLRIYTGSAPANCAAAATGTMLVEVALPSDWLAAASGGVKAMAGSWTGTTVAAGTAGYFRIWDTAVATCHEQGTATVTGGGGDMTIDNATVTIGQTLTVTTYSRTAGNA